MQRATTNRPAFSEGKNASNAPCAACPVRQQALCAALSDNEIGRLNEISVTRRYGAGETIIHEGSAAISGYNLISGHVKLYKLLSDGRRQITGFLVPGDFVGIASGELYGCSAEAIDDAVLCGFPRTGLDKLMQQFPGLLQRMLSIASDELMQAQEHALLLGRKTAAERVSTFLLSLARRHGDCARGDNGGLLVPLPMTRGDIADYLGLTTETVSRVLSELKRGNIIRLPNRSSVEIVSAEALESRSDQL